MLYNQPIDQITWDDVNTFCEQRISEGAYLDYKQDFPSQLEKTIAAMANTFGGIIFIGVSEDNESKPITPLEGIEFQRGLSERVMNIILTNIVPPVFPEIAVCTNTDSNKALLVIRIPQSHQTPHAIANNTNVYLRTGNRNSPEKLASIGEQEWLREHRRKSEELRENLYSRAGERFVNLYLRGLEELRLEGHSLTESTRGYLTLSLCPLYPKDSFLTPPELNTIYREIRVDDYYRTDSTFPLPDMGFGKIAQDGILLNRTIHTNKTYHTELNCLGLYFYKQSLLDTHSPREGSTLEFIRSTEIFCRLDEFIDSSIKYYDKINYRGILCFEVHLDNILECKLQKLSIETLLSTPDTDVRFSRNVLTGVLKDEKPQIILRSAQRIAWAFGWEITKETLHAYYSYYKPSYNQEFSD